MMTRVYGSAITGLAAYQPSHLVDNAELARGSVVTPEWIEQRTGIRTRGHASDEDLVAMSAEAGTNALAMASAAFADVDLVIVATVTNRLRIPGIAAQVASRIGIPAPGAFDVNAGCAGFTYSLSLASNAVQLGEAHSVLVIGADLTSARINPEDPDTFAIFGDGAGAVVVSRSAEPAIGPVVWGSDGERAGLLKMQNFGSANEFTTINGPLVYKWSTVTMPPVALRACERAGVDLTDVRWFVPHQANRRIIDTLTRMLDFPADRVSRDVADSGNTSAASVPLALSRLHESGQTSPGDLALLLGFGAGLTYAGQVIRMP